MEFQSVIVLDLETTGLPQLEHNTTKVVEVALLGCEIQHLKGSLELPRVLHKLVLCFDPRKVIQPDASRVSGLDNELLMNLMPFGYKDFEILKHFIERLPSPVCLVAHNGLKFDFPILKRQIEKWSDEFPNIYCADSWEGFREIYSEKPIISDITPMKEDGITIVRKEKEDNKIKEGYERPPENQEIRAVNSLNFKNENKVQVNVEPNISKLFPDDVSGCIDQRKYFTTKTQEVPLSYKLKDIYYFLHKNNFAKAHNAEVDATALLRCIIKCDIFFSWMNKNAVTFSSIKPLK